MKRLEVHLEDSHKVYLENGEEETAALKSNSNPAKLLGWFAANERFTNARHIRYIDYPKYFSWSKIERQWKPRAKYKDKNSIKNELDFTIPPHHVVGRVYNISPAKRRTLFPSHFDPS